MITDLPAILRIFAVFVLILAAIQKRFSLGNAFFLGSVMLGLVFGMPVIDVVASLASAFVDPKTVSLSLIVSLILVLSHSMEMSGQMARLLERFQGLIPHPGVNMAILPALIGLLPMPGGAIFSAPMVRTIGERRGFSGAQLSYVNYWFRHIWEYWWPLYPGVLLTTALAGIDFWRFVGFMVPLSAVAIVAGVWPLRAELLRKTDRQAADLRLKPFLLELTPVLVVVILGIGLGGLLSYLPLPEATPVKEAGLVIALILAIGWVWRINDMPAADRWAILKKRELLKMVYMVVGILIFQKILKDSRAVTLLSEELLRWRIPLMPITILLPFLVGGVAGITIAFVGTTFPILISLVRAFGQGDWMLSYMMLGLVGGFAGVLLSPLHLCLLLSNGYFNTRLRSVYRFLWLPCAALVLAGIVYFQWLRVMAGH